MKTARAMAWAVAGAGLWLAWSAPAMAQVAAPSLSPYGFVTENPAVMQWGSPSRIGIAYGQAQTVDNPKTFTDNFTTSGAGIRLVSQWVSFASDYQRADSDNKPNKTAEFNQTSRAALAGRIGSFLSLGVSEAVEEQRFFSGAGAALQTEDLPQAGLTLRLGEWLFLGGSSGMSSVKLTDLATKANDFTATREVHKYGAGIRTGGTVATHLEYYVVDRTRYSKHINSTLVGTGRANSRTGVAEFNFSGFLLGYATTHTEQDATQPKVDTDRLDIGWAPFTGWTYVLHGQIEKDTLPVQITTKSISSTSYSLQVTYLFKGV